MKYYSLFIGFSLLLIFPSCSSVHKYNETISAKHSISAMQEDVDVAYAQLQKFQPQLYQYISKEELDYSFDSLKKSFTKPMDSKEFAYALTAVVGKVGQAHNRVYIPNKRYTKKERKELIKYGLDFNKLDFDILSDTVFVSNNVTKDSLLTKAQVMAINEEPIDSLLNRYLPYTNSDGYNQTFPKKIITQRLAYFYYAENGRQDSINVTFQKNDSIFTKKFKRELIEKKEKEELMDSVKAQLKDVNNSKQRFIKKETPESKKLSRKKQKEIKEYNYIHGYNEDTQLYDREFSFIGEDSSVAYMKIRSFDSGNYKKFYSDSFRKIDSSGVQNLIIDGRDNTGGELKDIDELYSYLTDEDYVFLEPSEVTKRGAMYRALIGRSSTVAKFFEVLITPVLYPFFLSKTKKGEDGKIYYKTTSSKQDEPKENNFKGNVYYIVNGTSFSATTILATALDELPNVIIVGEEAGGDYNGTVAGNSNVKKLPNTDVTVSMGIMYISTPNKREMKGRGIFPDLEIQSGYSDILNGKDAEIDFILEDIKSKNQNSEALDD